MKRVYINGIGSVSAQQPGSTGVTGEPVLNTTANVLPVYPPDYKEYISPGLSRRMAPGVKNAIVASSIAIKDAGIPEIDAIITGTGVGCIKDSESFLRAIIDNKEEFLTPTSFIQSTHNTVGAQIALGLSCKGYNFTYVNGAVSFESSVMDALLQLENEEAESILVGGVEESAEFTFNFFKLAGLIKDEKDAPYSILDSGTKAAVYGEGATFFVLQNKKSDSTYAELKAVSMVNSMRPEEINPFITVFLSENDLTTDDVDAIILGYNGDVAFDGIYKTLSGTLFGDTPQVYYKHLSGEYNTASSFGLMVAANIVRDQKVPDVLKANDLEKPHYKNILLYNQYRGKDHSLTLISQC